MNPFTNLRRVMLLASLLLALALTVNQAHPDGRFIAVTWHAWVESPTLCDACRH